MLVSCSSDKNGAEDVTFYYRISIENASPNAEIIKEELEAYFPTKKYAITNSSGLEKPFYQEFDPEEVVPKDSIMPPHTFVHRMVNLKNHEPEEGSRLLEIILFPKKTNSYSMQIFLRKEGEWKFQAQTGTEDVGAQDADIQDVIRQFRQSIIRFSFK